MGMAPNQLFTDRRSDIIEIKSTGLGSYLSMENRLQEKVAQLIDNGIAIPALNRFSNFIGLFNEMFDEALMSLFRIPGASPRSPEDMHDRPQPFERG